MGYSDKFKEKAIKRVLASDGIESKSAIAKELKVSKATLYKWVSESSEMKSKNGIFDKAAQLQILRESYGLEDEALSAYCREKGIFEHQIEIFQDNLLSSSSKVVPSSRKELEKEKLKNKALEKELRRKEKALAETAALLVLQKKFQALFQDEES